jgi:uncharacterized protein YkwD
MPPSLDGKRARRHGWAGQPGAENILYGTTDARRALDLWMNSQDHRANTLTCSFTLHGVGRVERHWTHLFIRPPPAGTAGR